jgi:type IV pilus assembly protein PilC
VKELTYTIRETSPISLNIFRRKVPRKIFNNFTRDLSILHNARILLADSIDILSQQINHQKFKKVLRQISIRLKSGASLSETFRLHPEIFDSFYLNLVEVGEVTGSLDEMLSRLAIYQEKIADLKRKLIQALTYPALVILVALVSLTFILLYVIPTFSGIFKDFDAQLPWPTLVLIGFSDFLKDNSLFILLFITGLIFLVRYSKSLQRIQVMWDNFVLKLPVLGSMVTKNYISQFCRTLGTLLESGISLLTALDIASRTTRNHHIRKDILQMKYFAEKGEKLTRSLHQSEVFPVMVTQMIAIGEETAELPGMLIKIAEYYDKEIDSSIEILGSIIEPVMIVILGIIIGAILISIYLPLFNLANVMPG